MALRGDRGRSARSGTAAARGSAARRQREQARRGSGRQQRHARRLTPQQQAARRHPAEPDAAPRMTLTTRAAVLALAFCAVLLTLAYPVKEYLAQRAGIAAQRAQQRATEQRVAALAGQHAAAQSPTQVQADARSRLHFVMPGQKNYIPLHPPSTPAPPVASPGHAKVSLDPRATWYGRLWNSDVAAGSS